MTVDVFTDEEADALVLRLVAKLLSGQSELQRLDLYYRGKQPLAFLHPEIELAVGERLKNVVINWPRLVIDSLEERLDVTGFRMPGEDDADTDIWKIWQANGFDLASGQTHLGALKHGRSFVTVWSDPDDNKKPRFAVETAHQMVVDYQPGTREVRAALKSWKDPSGTSYATLYLVDRVIKYRRNDPSDSGLIVVGKLAGSWVRYDVLDNPLGVVTVIPFLNRYDSDAPDGETELSDVLPLADAVNKLATDMMVTSEFHAMPRRYATGIEVPKGNEGKRLEEEAKKYWENASPKRIWLAGTGVNFGQFAAADLQNFIAGIRLLATQAAALAALPPHELGVIGDSNPASADAIRAAEARKVRLAKRKQRTFEEPWETVVRLGLMIRDGAARDDALELETIWADPATPTVAQVTDAAVKAKTAGIIDDEQAQEDLGYSPAQRRRMAERRAAAIAAQADAATAARVAEALALMDEDGVDAKVAFAAVGLVLPPKGGGPGPEAPPVPAGDSIDSGAA